MTYSELIDVVRHLHPAMLEPVQFETNRKGLDADDLFWELYNVATVGIEVMAWRLGVHQPIFQSVIQGNI